MIRDFCCKNTPMKKLFLSVMLFAMTLCCAARGDEFTPPANGAYTEKQLTEAIGVSKDLLDIASAAGKAVEGTKSTAVALATIARTDAKYKEALAKHNLSEAEYNWISGQIWTAYGTLIQVDTFNGEQAQKDFADQQKKQADALDVAKKKLADLEAAQKSGKRVLSADERASIIDNAKSDEQSAT